MTRRFLYIIVMLFATAFTAAAAYTVEQIPNVHRSSRTRYVSNPDGILSESAVARIDSMLAQVWRASSAEVVVVAVDDIDHDSDIQEFATELFAEWGIGKKDKDNGLLVLIVKDQRQAVIRTGYGIEGVVPDVLAGRIIRNDMAPDFRAGDYDSGTVKAVSRLAGVITDPEVREELMSEYGNDAGASSDDGESLPLFKGYMVVAGVATMALLVVFISMLVGSAGLDRVQRYRSLDRLSTPSLFMSFLFLGGPLIVFLPLRLVLRHLRRGRRDCPNCGHRMDLVDEERDNFYLTPAQDTEERINSVDYDVWLCPQCGETDIIPYVNKVAGFVECPECHARAAEHIGDRITTQPTTAHEGVVTSTYYCRNCHNRFFRQRTLPKIVVVSGGGGFGGGGGGFSGGGFSGGSFGGGMTGGGGARGGW